MTKDNAMQRYQNISYVEQRGKPYEVLVHWNDDGREVPSTICLSEGSGHGAQGSCFLLSEMLEDTWTEHLRICDCLWLRDLAREEQQTGRYFSADELWEMSQARTKANKTT